MTIETFDFSLLAGLVNLALVAKLMVGLSFLALFLGFAQETFTAIFEAGVRAGLELAEEEEAWEPALLVADTKVVVETTFGDLLMEQILEDLEKLARTPRQTQGSGLKIPEQVLFGHPDWAATAVW